MSTKNFAKYIRDTRKVLNLSIVEMAADFGSTPALLRDFEVGRKDCSLRMKALIRHYFLLFREEREPAKKNAESTAEYVKRMFKQAGEQAEKRKEDNMRAFWEAFSKAGK